MKSSDDANTILCRTLNFKLANLKLTVYLNAVGLTNEINYLAPQIDRLMAKKSAPVNTTNYKLFGKENYIWMIAGIAVIALGLILMAGGRSKDPNVFNPDEVYSTTRITIAPILILLGLGIEVFAIFRKPKTPNRLGE